MKYLALSWAEGSDQDLQKMDFVFHIALKQVRDDTSIENIIIQQHPGLKANNVKPEEIKAILEPEPTERRSKVLLLFGWV